MKRLFWVALGLGAGATGAVMTSRWMKKQTDKVAPQNIARTAGAGFAEASKRLAASIEEGRRAAADREAEVREKAGLD